jgi:hypothetical protein
MHDDDEPFPFEAYYLDLTTKEPVLIKKWGDLVEAEDRGCMSYHVARDEYENIMVSTVFLGMGKTMFETMLFVDGYPAFCVRWKNYDEAVEGHATVLKQVKEKLLL